MNTTYRVVELTGTRATGGTAASPDLAKLVAGELSREGRLGIEQTDWGEKYERPHPIRTVLIDAETRPREWTIGA